MFGLEFELGTLLTLLTFLRSEVGGRHSKEDLLCALEAANKTERFREWLRQKDQTELVHEIKSSQSELLSELASMGGRLDMFASEVLQIYDEFEQRFRDLNERIRPPVLSSFSLPTRPRAGVSIKGRERELKWLNETGGDALVSGQPGSGKTELLQTFAAHQSARFLITDNPDEAASAVLAGTPAIVIIDDAGTRTELIVRLRHLRIEHGLRFRMIAICWPFDKVTLQHVLNITDLATLELEGLPRKVIAEIINEIATAQRIAVSDQFIRVVAKQARGMPGLAASLSLATIAQSGTALVSGELLLKDLSSFLLRTVGPHSVQLLAAFACGGTKGISYRSVAKNLELQMMDVQRAAERIALAGVLEQTGSETLCIQPEFLRSALLKETFFLTDKIVLPLDVCEALIESAEDPMQGILELVYARGRAGAAVPSDYLRTVTARVNNSRIWSAMATLDESSCAWVVETSPALSPEIKRAALYYIPLRIIPTMLEAAASETRSLNAYPDADLRLLEDWIAESWADAVKRRRTLFDATMSWLKTGGDIATAMSAVRLSFGLIHHESDSDPADPRTIRYRDVMLPLDAAELVFGQWEIFLTETTALDKLPLAGLISVVNHWLHSDLRVRGAIDDHYAEFLLSSTRQMIGDLLPLASENQVALRWLYFEAIDLDVLIDPCPLNPDFMVLFPKEPFDLDWETIARAQNQDAHQLSVRWQNRPFTDIVEDLVRWGQQANALGGVWPCLIAAFSEKLAEIKTLLPAELSVAIGRLPQEGISPFVDAALASGSITSTHFQEILARTELHGLLLHYTLTGKTPEFYPQLESQIPKWKRLVEGLVHSGRAPVEMLERLLSHADRYVRRDVALQMFRAKTGVPESLRDLWRGTIIQCLIECASELDPKFPHDLQRLLDSDPRIASPVLDGILSSGDQFHGSFATGLLSQIISPLEKEERRALLHRCKDLSYSQLPALLVGRDEDLYCELLSIPELKHFYSSVLLGDPNQGNWIALAKIALAAGYNHSEISHAVDSAGFSRIGNLSNYYHEWVERFQRLRSNSDFDIQRIAVEGLNWSIMLRDFHRKRESRVEILGWD